jgi:hypothetical protein
VATTTRKPRISRQIELPNPELGPFWDGDESRYPPHPNGMLRARDGETALVHGRALAAWLPSGLGGRCAGGLRAGKGPRRRRARCRGIACACGDFGLTCRIWVVAFRASVDGSLWYGDLPASDGARDDRHSLRFSLRA